MRKLEKLGAITCIQKGKSGSFTRRANLYRREVCLKVIDLINYILLKY